MNTNLGANIRNYRKNKGFTQDELASMLGVTPQAVSRWESEAGLPDVSMIVPIAQALGITTDILLGYNASVQDDYLADKIKEQLATMNNISDLHGSKLKRAEYLTSVMEGMLDKVKKEIVTGEVEVREVYKISKVGTVAGAMVIEGKVHRSDKCRVIRDGIVVHTAEINALKRFKDDVKEVATNFECGISLVNFNDIQQGDILETFTEIEVKQSL